jgi:hypothetical protein
LRARLFHSHVYLRLVCKLAEASAFHLPDELSANLLCAALARSHSPVPRDVFAQSDSCRVHFAPKSQSLSAFVIGMASRGQCASVGKGDFRESLYLAGEAASGSPRRRRREKEKKPAKGPSFQPEPRYPSRRPTTTRRDEQSWCVLSPACLFVGRRRSVRAHFGPGHYELWPFQARSNERRLSEETALTEAARGRGGGRSAFRAPRAEATFSQSIFARPN